MTPTLQVGQRHRRDLGDVDQLAASIAELGLLQPIVITPTGTLIAGERRLQACMALGWTDVPVHVADIDAIVRGELAENVYRKDFTPSEMVAIAATVEKRERELAKQRMSEGGKVGKLSTPSDAGKTRDKIAAPLGVSGRTLEKARADREQRRDRQQVTAERAQNDRALPSGQDAIARYRHRASAVATSALPDRGGACCRHATEASPTASV